MHFIMKHYAAASAGTSPLLLENMAEDPLGLLDPLHTPLSTQPIKRMVINRDGLTSIGAASVTHICYIIFPWCFEKRFEVFQEAEGVQKRVEVFQKCSKVA